MLKGMCRESNREKERMGGEEGEKKGGGEGKKAREREEGRERRREKEWRGGEEADVTHFCVCSVSTDCSGHSQRRQHWTILLSVKYWNKDSYYTYC